MQCGGCLLVESEVEIAVGLGPQLLKFCSYGLEWLRLQVFDLNFETSLLLLKTASLVVLYYLLFVFMSPQ